MLIKHRLMCLAVYLIACDGTDIDQHKAWHSKNEGCLLNPAPPAPHLALDSIVLPHNAALFYSFSQTVDDTVDLNDFNHYKVFQLTLSNFYYSISCVSPTYYSIFRYFFLTLLQYLFTFLWQICDFHLWCYVSNSSEITNIYLPSCTLAVAQTLHRSAQRPPLLWQCYISVADLQVQQALVLGHHCQTSSQLRWTTVFNEWI